MSENIISTEGKELPKVRFNEDAVNLDELVGEGNEIKPLSQTRSVLEFIIVALCKSMSLTPKQSAALLSDNKKYLNHILIKGLSKKIFGPVKQFYQEVLANIDYFLQLIQINSIVFPNQISKNIELSLSTFKPGLLSKNIDVVYIAGRLLSKLALELIEINLISAAWDWFVMPNGGLEACILCLKRHDTAVEVVVTLINNFGRFHIYELFTIYLKNFMQNDGAYFTFVSDIIEKFSRLTQFNDEFSKNNLKEFFLEYLIEVSRSPNINEKMKTALFLAEIWINFSVYIESKTENYQMLSIFKTLYKDPNRLVQTTAISQLFRVLLAFSAERNSFVPVIYKALIFNFIEYHHDIAIRDFMISNFQYAFKVILSIPVGILVEPYVKQINLCLGSSYYFNINDVAFLITIARHPRFNVKEAVLALDVLGKVYFDIGKDEKIEEEAMRANTYRGIFFYKLVNSVFTMILSRYLMHEVGVEFCFKYVKMLIQSFCRLDRPLSDKIYLNAIVLNVNPEDNKEKLVFEEDIILNEKEKNNNVNYRSLSKIVIVQMVQDILRINNTFINGVIKNLLIVAAIRHFKVYSFHNIGLSKMLSHFGNCHDLVYYYNINRDELDIDTEFEISIEIIYDKLPEYLPTANDEIEKNGNEQRKNTEKEEVKNKRGESANKSQKGKFNLKKNKTIEQQKEDKKSNSDKEKTNINNLNLAQVKHLKNLKESLVLHHKTTKRPDDYVFFHERFSNYKKKAKNDDPRFLKTNNNIELLDLNFEEDRDLIKLKKFLKDYQTFFKEVFMKYCGSIYHPIKGKVFNSINEIGDTISPSEIVKMFQEHGISGREIDREDILIILSLMNSKVFQKPSLKSGISYDEFIEDFIQLSYFAFTKPPFVYRRYTISEYAEEMIKLFSRQFPDNKKYLHPDKLINANQIDICENINKQLQKTNFVKIPKGFKKYLETELVYKYYVPDCMYFLLGESQTICYELLDEIIYKIVKEHIMEGFCKVKEVYKIRPFKELKSHKKVQREEYEKEKMKNKVLIFKKKEKLNSY